METFICTSCGMESDNLGGIGSDGKPYCEGCVAAGNEADEEMDAPQAFE